MEARSRKAEQSETTRADLIRAARDLFGERGYGGVATEEIVAAARVTRGALYHHFRDKRDLFRAVFLDADRAMMQGVAEKALAEEDAWERLRVGTAAFLDACLDRSVQRIVFVDAPAVLGFEEWHSSEPADSARGLMAFALQGAADAGLLRAGNVWVFANLVLGAMNEAGMLIANSDDPQGSRAQVGEALAELLEGLRAEPERG